MAQIINSVQQVSELIMTIENTVDLDSGNGSLLAQFNCNEESVAYVNIKILGIAILRITTYVSHMLIAYSLYFLLFKHFSFLSFVTVEL